MSAQRKQSMIALMKIQKMNQAHQQTQSQLQEIAGQHRQAQEELQQHKKQVAEQKKRAAEAEKRYRELEKQHKDAMEEMHDLKLNFDGDYAFRFKEEQRATNAKARQAKNDARKKVKELRDIKRSKTG